MKIRPAFWLFIAALCLAWPALAEQDAPGGEGEAESEAGDADRPVPSGPRERPLWEIGVVGGGGWLPDYPAADQNHVNGIALPYAVYRGEFFRAGDGAGPRGLFVDIPWLELNVGLDASFPVDSDDNDARRGMDDLDYLLEAGPKLIGKLLADDPVNELDLSLAGRVVLSTDFKGVGYQGLTVNPAITYRRNGLFDIDLRAIAAVGATFGFDGFNEYFYEVGPADVRADRPRHRADPGYVGSEVSLGLSWGVTERIQFFGGTQIGFWTGSANDDSPLYRDEVTYAVGGGLRWTFFTSDRKVRR
ncbi:MAG: MipA/OmpV family protein [Rhodospirillales bacterium]|nr:MipA/OmpV family protein [Rhodospirillales bacterium]MDH3910979.1 MipA/OmpV family protein [Rhodospirillales bacterium]MDH3919908.1 MipA/OmpV family protein [Rhodospirillales bacterium]MDH3968282.1 MipA/OmpV family protein [Rhodospirillales bacterium]